MTLAGVRLKTHPLTPLTLMLAAVFTGGGALIRALCALGLHECAHLLAAIKLRAQIQEIELMPYGGAIRMRALWETPAARLAIISLAGPAANALAACVIALMVYAYPPIARNAKPFIDINIAITLINLMPALPLDGGRALCAILTRKLGVMRAVRVGLWAGRALALIMIIGALVIFIYTGKLKLYLMLWAIYIIASGERERAQAEGAALRALLIMPDPPQGTQEARWLAARAQDTIYSAARMISPGKPHLIAVIDEGGNLVCVLSQQSISNALTKDAHAPLSSLINMARDDRGAV